jgi:protoheme ferro-lyase
MMISPEGDVPPFFTWDAYRETLDEIYTSFGGGSPHNESLAQHIANLDLGLDGAEVETYLAFLDAVPRIPDAMWEITREHDYDKMVVVPMLLSSSTHTQEVEEQIEAVLELTGDMEMVVAEPFYEVPYMRSMIAEAVMAMADHVRGNVPPDVADDDIGLLLVAHGTPYVPPYPAFGYEEGDIYSNLSLTESGFHEEIEEVSPWAIRTGRMNYAAPSIDESLAAFEADGKSHVLVIPAAFPTAAMHTMWDVAEPAVGRAALPEEGIIVHTRESGMTVYYSAQGYADLEQGGEAFRSGLAFIANSGVLELLHGDADAAP